MNTTFSKVPILGRFRIKSTGEVGIRIKKDCVTGIQFNVNAVHARGESKGRLFFVGSRTRVIVPR